MKKRIDFIEFKLPATHSQKELRETIRKKLGDAPYHYALRRKSLDARDKNNIHYLYTVEYSKKPLDEETPIERLAENKQPSLPVVVVGSGPAGLFCALRLLERGIRPIVVERGAPVDERERKIDEFIANKTLDANTNIQFGEGGAGTFSDGKLNTQTHNGLLEKVLKTFHRFGAPEEILWLNKPHIGSDNLKKVVKNMREYIEKEGGQVCFHTQLIAIKRENEKVKEITLCNLKTKTTKTLAVSALVLAIGHSARDTFQMLHETGVTMTAKDFAVGVRIEHLQKEISLAQYGEKYPFLPPADYKLVSHAFDRSAFTFCMCPGGYVMPATSEEGGVVTNGMSNYKRNGKNANSALIVQVRKSDFESEHPLAGIEFQRKIERAAFSAGGKDYKAPVQLVKDFLQNRESSAFGGVLPTYGAGTAFADMRAVLPAFLIDPLKKAITDMNSRLHGFACPEAVLTGAETRTSSPVRIERDGKTLQSVALADLYPCGEGAGYAGGISSSAVDGIRVADAIFEKMH